MQKCDGKSESARCRGEHKQIVDASARLQIVQTVLRSADPIRQSRAELNEYLSAGEDFDALLARWETERVTQIVARETAKWECRTQWCYA
jgi:hypothetical protein